MTPLVFLALIILSGSVGAIAFLKAGKAPQEGFSAQDFEITEDDK